MKTDEEREREMVESPAYRLGVATAIIQAMLKWPGDRTVRERAAEFLKEESERTD